MLHIYQPSALITLTSVEGDEWGRQQEAEKSSPHGFYAHLTAYNRRVKYLIDYPEEEGDLLLSEFEDVRGLKDATGVVRYHIMPSGEIVYLASSGNDQIEHRAKAVAAGIRVDGPPVTADSDQ